MLFGYGLSLNLAPIEFHRVASAGMTNEVDSRPSKLSSILDQILGPVG
jgi:hypothetical protein